jgi:RNA polymerase sigma-70 factor, ECF subfamily
LRDFAIEAIFGQRVPEKDRRGSPVTPDPHAGLPALMPRLAAFARTMVGDGELARDLVQEAAARALAARRVPDEPPAYRAWIFRIVRNAAIDELRSRRGRPDAVPAPAPVDLWRFDDARIAKITVEQGLAALAPEYREIIALIDIAGFSYAEAAEFVAVPLGTIMSRISRARIALLAAIEASSVRPLTPGTWTSGGQPGGRSNHGL